MLSAPLMTIFTALGVAIIALTLYSKTRKSNTAQENLYNHFLDTERDANFSRKKDPVPEDYLSVDIHTLPICEYPDEPAYARVAARQNNVLEISRLPMIFDVRGMSNRELKLKYGTANLDMIVTYEENYDRFIHNLLEWAAALIVLGNTTDATAVLEAAVGHRCDRSQAYTMLADITTGRKKLEELRIKAASKLEGPAAGRALAYIEERLERFTEESGSGPGA